MTIESISIRSVHATVGCCPFRVAAVAWLWLEAVLGSADSSKSSGPPTDDVTVSRRATCISAEDSITHLLLLNNIYNPLR